MRIPVAEYAPDRADLDQSVYTVATNVIPASGCYLPARALQALPTTDALPSKPLGLFLAQRSDGEFFHFTGAADGADYKLYYYDHPDWIDCSQAGFYASFDAESGVRFAQYGDYVYAATGANNDIQSIDLNDLATGFADVTGTGGTDPPRAKFITVINEFVVLAGLTDYPTSVQWSEIGDADGWRIGTGGCDRQEFADGGLVTGITATEYGLVFQENSIRRFAFNPGSPYVFEFARVAAQSGTSAISSICQANGRTFWLGEDGFWSESGAQLSPIGAERVNRTFLADIEADNIPHVQGYADPLSMRVFWAYPSGSQSPELKNKVICYHYLLDRWSLIETDLTLIGPVAQPGISIDDEPLASSNIDTLGQSLDDAAWRGGRPQVGGFDKFHRLGKFSGATLEATITTGAYQFASPNRAMVQRVSPLVDATGATVRIAVKENMYALDSWRAEQTVSGTGHTHWTASGRYLKGQVRIPAETAWSKFQGIEVTAKSLGLF